MKKYKKILALMVLGVVSQAASAKCWVSEPSIKSCDPSIAAKQTKEDMATIRIESNDRVKVTIFFSEKNIKTQLEIVPSTSLSVFNDKVFVNAYAEKDGKYGEDRNGCIEVGKIVLSSKTKTYVPESYDGNCQQGQINAMQTTKDRGGSKYYLVK
jgi:hypothetical protein